MVERGTFIFEKESVEDSIFQPPWEDAVLDGLKISEQGFLALENSIRDGVIDNYELSDSYPTGPHAQDDSLISYYEGDLSYYERTQSDVGEGSHALATVNSDGTNTVYAVSSPGDGLPLYPSGDDRVAALLRDANDESEPDPVMPTFLFNSTINANGNLDGYGVALISRSDIQEARLYKYSDATAGATGRSELDSISVNIQSETYYWVEVEPGTATDPTHTATIHQADISASPPTRGGLLGTLEATDSDFVSSDGVGISRESGDNNGTVLDYIHDPSIAGVRVTETSSSQLTNRSGFQARPVIAERSDGVWVMIYNDASEHGADDRVKHIRFSDDQGDTWTDDDTDLNGNAVSGFPYDGGEWSPGSGVLFEAPNGDLIAQFNVRDSSAGVRGGTHQLRSSDGGITWTDEGQVSFSGIADDEALGGQDYFIHPDTDDVYVGIFVDPGADMSMPYKSGIARSQDDGSTWSYLSDITTTSDGTNEVGIEYLGSDEIIAVMRDDGDSATYQSKSADLGSTWGALEDISVAFSGPFQKPELAYDGALRGDPYTNGPLWLWGRDARIPGSDTDAVLAYSLDDGNSWAVAERFTEGVEETGYSDLAHRSGDEYYYATYEGSSNSETDVYGFVFELE